MGIQVSYLGVDGTYWDLTTGKVRLSGTGTNGVEGLGEPKWNRNTIESAGTDGQRRTGQRSRASARQGYFPLLILGDDALDWSHTSAAWWRAWSPDIPGLITVAMPDGSQRTIAACLSDDDTYAPIMDPALTATEQIGLTWIADDPFWRSATISATFQVGDGGAPADFFNGGGAPPFNLSAGNTAADIVMSNPGELEAFPTYTVTGPATTFSVTLGGKVVSGSIAVETGQTLQIITDPAMQVAWLFNTDGTAVNVTPQLSSVNFGSIPAGTSSRVDATISGTGSLTVSFDPRYRRAW